MRTLKTIFITLIAVAVLAIAAGIGVIYSGVYNVAATDKHWPIVYWLLHETVEHSIAAHAKTIEVPALGDRQQVLAGAANYKAMCADCHAAPGIEQRTLARAMMYPKPPLLDDAAEEMTPAQLFWVIKYGIKASGMPAWGSSHSDEDLWSMVALIQKFPGMTAAEYEQLQQAAADAGIGHHHHGEDAHHGNEGEAHGHDEAGVAHHVDAEDEGHGHVETSDAHHGDDAQAGGEGEGHGHAETGTADGAGSHSH